MSSLFFLHQCEQALVSPRSPPMAARSAPQSWGSRKETDRRLPVECDPPPLARGTHLPEQAKPSEHPSIEREWTYGGREGRQGARTRSLQALTAGLGDPRGVSSIGLQPQSHSAGDRHR